MANIGAVTGRHIWRRALLMHGNDKVPGILCENCRAYRYGEDPDRPVTGCLSEVRVANCGTSRLADYREQEMQRRKEQDDRELAHDLADIAMTRQSHPDSEFQKHLDRLLERELS